MDFSGFIKDIKTNNWNVHGVEVYEHKLLKETWGDTTTKFPVYSATKTILSIALGIAWDRGLIDFNRSIIYYLPESVVADLSEKQKNQFEKITLHRLMTMSVEGFPFRPKGDDYLKYTLSVELPEPEKIAFNYSNLSAYLCGVALTQALGSDAGKFIENEIFKPLCIQNARIGYSPEGFFYGASNIELSVNDLSKIGLLLLNKGLWDNKQIVSSAYVEKATSVLQINREGGYGYFICKYGNGFSINGKWKQKCYVLPEKDLIITFLSDIRDDCPLRESMEKHLLT